jgi:hypothetical protein
MQQSILKHDDKFHLDWRQRRWLFLGSPPGERAGKHQMQTAASSSLCFVADDGSTEDLLISFDSLQRNSSLYIIGGRSKGGDS